MNLKNELRISKLLNGYRKRPEIIGAAIELGHGTVLARLVAEGGLWRIATPDTDVLAALLFAAYGPRVDSDRASAMIKSAMRSLIRGNRSGAAEALAALRLDPLSVEDAERLLAVDRLLKSRVSPAEALARTCPISWTKYDPAEPRDERGRWTADGSAASRGDQVGLIPAADQKRDWADQADKEKFVDANLAAAQRVADRLGIPVENLLGLAASENSYGMKGRFAAANNILNMHYPAPLAIDQSPSKEDKTVAVAVYASTADCMNSFALRFGSLIQGISDPQQFLTILQNAHAFGVYPDGSPNPVLLRNGLDAIRQIRVLVSRRKI